MKKVFVSYASGDGSFARKLHSALSDLKVAGWMDSSDIAAGAEVSRDVRLSIRESDAMVVLVSPRSLSSSWVNFEVGAALSLGKPVIPILIEGADVEHDLPTTLRDIQYFDARNKPIDEIVREVKKALPT